MSNVAHCSSSSPRFAGVFIALLVLLFSAGARGQQAENGAASKAANSGAKPQEKPQDKKPENKTVVTASRHATQVFEVPADAWVVDRDHLGAPIKNIREALQHIPGVQLNQRQENAMFIGGLELRGFGSNQTSGGNALILLDGIPQRRLSFGGPYMGALPLEAVERAELVKGPLSALYGRGSLSGALQLFTSDGDKDWELRTRTLFDARTNLFKQAITVGGPLEPISDDSSFSITTSLGVADGWQDDTDSDKRDLYGHFKLQLTPEDRLTVIGGYVNGYEGVAAPVLVDDDGERLAGIDRDDNLGIPGHNWLELEEVRAGISWTHEFSKTLRSKLTVAYWQADTEWAVGRPSARPVNGVINRVARKLDWEEDSIFIEAQASGDFDLGDELLWKVAFGGSYEHMNWDQAFVSIRTPSSTFGEGVPLDLGTRVETDPATWIYSAKTVRETEENHWGIFLSNELLVGDRLRFDVGCRLDGFARDQENRSSGVSGSSDDIFFSPRLGASYLLIEEEGSILNAYGSWSRGFNPIFRQVASNEVVDIEPESSQSFELGLKGAFFDRQLEATFAAYRVDRDDVVGYNPAATTFQNTGDWRVDGLEFGLVWHPRDHLDVYGTYSVRDASIQRDAVNSANEGKDIPMVASHLAAIGLRYTPPSGLGGEARLRYVGTASQDTANTVESPSYALLDASIFYQWENARLTLFGRNLLDEEYFADTFLNTTGVAFMGLPVSVGAELNLRF